MKYPSVDIIICTYNNEGIISECLKRIRNLNYPFRECIVVDDYSNDNTVKVIKEDFPWVKTIEKKVQTGPSESRNIAINKSNADLLLFLDSDIQVTNNFLSKLVKAANQFENVAICGGKLLLPDGSIDAAGGGLTKLGIGFDIGHKKNRQNYSQGKDMMYIPSAAMLVNRKLIQEIGSFDDTYFYGHEDTDLCWRVNIAGFRVYYEPSAIAFHYKNRTISKMIKNVHYYGTRNRIRSLIKNHQLSTLFKYLPLYMMFSFFDIIFRSYKKEKVSAWWWNMMNLRDTLQKRKGIQALRVFSDFELPFFSMGHLFKVSWRDNMAKEKLYCDRCGKRIKIGKHCNSCIGLLSKQKRDSKQLYNVAQYGTK